MTFGRELIRIIAMHYNEREETKAKREYEKIESLSITTAGASYCLNNASKILAHVGFLTKQVKVM